MIVTASARRMSPSATPDPVVLIISSAYNSLPAPGNRVGPSDAANMPTIQASTGNPAFVTADGAHHFRLVGLHIRAPSTLLQNAVVKIGGGETTLAEFPTDVTIDRCIVRGDATTGGRRGIALDAIRGAVIDSYIYDIKEDGADSQAVFAYNTPGPLKIVNNYLEGAGENIMFGGAAQNYANVLVSDVEIRRNHFKKQAAASWKASWTIKNLLEFKATQRALVEGNVFDTNYLDAQAGYSILITPRTEDGASMWNVVNDITLRYNYLKNCEAGMNISGTDGVFASDIANRINYENNLFVLKNLGEGGDIRGAIMSGGANYVQFLHNTIIFESGTTGNATFFVDQASTKGDYPTFRDNVFAAGTYGLFGSGSGEGTAGLSGHFTNYTYSYNVMYGSSNPGDYPVANNQFPTAASDVFNDFTGGDYTVKAAYQGDASDATDPGADISALDAMVLHSEDGQWGSEPATYTDHTYTNAELPRTYVDTTYHAQSGTTHTCTSAAEFTTALANCALGDTIVLTAGNTFTGSFTLRAI